MTIRNLQQFFEPRSVALVGASERAGSVGSILMRNLIGGGLDGPVFPVNPGRASIHGLPAFPGVGSLPQPPDIAVIATPPETVPGLIGELGRIGTRAAIVITAGFGEGGRARGRELRQAMLDAAKPHLLRIVGPNCFGIMVPHVGLNTSFGRTAPPPGRLAFVTQSGAIAAAVVDWAGQRGLGFSHIVSLGDMADIDFGDMLDYLAADRRAQAILLYIEAVTSARKFMSAARATARRKPVIVMKAGRFPEGARAAASHTGAMAGADEVYDAVFRRAGVLRVLTLGELFDGAETLGKVDPPDGDGMAILTNGGGVGVLAADAVIERGGRLARLEPATLEALDRILPSTWSRGNPVDIVADASAERYRQGLEIVVADGNVDAVLVLHCPSAMSDDAEDAQAVVDVAKQERAPIVLTSWLGGASVEPARRLFAEHGIPSYATPYDAVRAFMHLVECRRNRFALTATPPSAPAKFAPDTAGAGEIIAEALASGRELLTEAEAKAVLASYGIATTTMQIAGTPDEAAAAAGRFDGPVVLKILSPDITHKSDVGGVALDLDTPGAVRAAACAMLERVRAAEPQARLDGFVVQEMVRRPNAHELIVGMSSDPQFGPMLLFGRGGTAVELIGDTTLELPPLDLKLAREMMARTRVHKLLEGFRDRPPADREAIALTLLQVSQMVVDLPQIRELDINPLLADETGVIALDARIRLAPYGGHPHERLAIRPYPSELEETVRLGDGRELLLRPIRPEDEPALQAAFPKLAPEEVCRGLLAPVTSLDHAMAARLTQIDYDLEMALVLAEPGVAGEAEIHGVARIAADLDNLEAECAVAVGSDATGKELGNLLMNRIIAYARARGIERIFGKVPRRNRGMLGTCEALGFRQRTDPDDPQMLRVALDL